jgi:hypothetical protein
MVFYGTTVLGEYYILNVPVLNCVLCCVVLYWLARDVEDCVNESFPRMFFFSHCLNLSLVTAIRK